MVKLAFCRSEIIKTILRVFPFVNLSMSVFVIELEREQVSRNGEWWCQLFSECVDISAERYGLLEYKRVDEPRICLSSSSSLSIFENTKTTPSTTAIFKNLTIYFKIFIEMYSHNVLVAVFAAATVASPLTKRISFNTVCDGSRNPTWSDCESELFTTRWLMANKTFQSGQDAATQLLSDANGDASYVWAPRKSVVIF